MERIAAQFLITDQLFTTHDTRNSKDDIFSEVITRLRNRSAEFDKIIQDDGDGDFTEQLHDRDAEINSPATFVTIIMEMEKSAVEKILESDPDIVFVKAISVLQSDDVKIESDTVQNNIAHLIFS